MKRLKTERKTILLTSLFVLLPIAAGLYLWNRLPDQIPIHFNFSGEADGWSSRPFAVFVLPLFLLAVHLLMAIATAYDPKGRGFSDRIYRMLLWTVPIISWATNLSVYGIAVGMNIRIDVVVRVLTGFLFIIIGNYMPKVRQNMTVGIKIPWTLADPENWNKTHRLAGKLFLISGILTLMSIFLPGQAGMLIMFCSIIIAAVFPMIYSFQLYRKSL